MKSFVRYISKLVKRFISKERAYKLKKYSVFIGIGGWVVMITSGQVIVAAGVKLMTEMLRIPYYLHTDANDMFGLASFFVTTSIVAITLTILG